MLRIPKSSMNSTISVQFQKLKLDLKPLRGRPRRPVSSGIAENS